MGRDGDRCFFEAYVDPSIAEIYEQETGAVTMTGHPAQTTKNRCDGSLNALYSLQNSATGELFRT